MNFTFNGEKITVIKDYYTNNNRLAVLLRTENGEPYATLSANVPTAKLLDGEFAVKNYSGNEEIAKAAMYSGIFVDTGKRVQSGYVEMPVWRFRFNTQGAESGRTKQDDEKRTYGATSDADWDAE